MINDSLLNNSLLSKLCVGFFFSSFKSSLAQFFRNDDQSEGIKYEVEVSLPQYFTLPRTVTIPVKKDTNMLQESPAGTSP